MKPNVIHKIPGGYECDMASTPDGWVIAAVSMEAVDDRYISNMDFHDEWQSIKALLRPGVTAKDWNSAYLNLKPTLTLQQNRRGAIETIYTTSSEQFSGVATFGGEQPAFIWSEYDGTMWNVHQYENGSSKKLVSGQEVLISPTITKMSDGSVWTAWVRREGSQDIIELTGSDLKTIRITGRNPSLTPLEDGIAICFERFENSQSHIYFAKIIQGSMNNPIKVSSREPLNFLPSITSQSDGKLLIVWESSPKWGFDVRVDQVRHIELKSIDPETDQIYNGPGTELTEGSIPIPSYSFNRGHGFVTVPPSTLMINLTPSNPLIIPIENKLACTFRVYHPDPDGTGGAHNKESDKMVIDGGLNPDFKGNKPRPSWYICSTIWDGNSWSFPRRISESYGFSFHPYGAIMSKAQLIVAAHCFDQNKFPSRNHRIEVVQDGGDGPAMHEGIRTFKPRPTFISNNITSAPGLKTSTDNRILVFGDLHDHTSHSSCYPTLDGSPRDNVRLQRDVMKNEVICLADHHQVSDSDFRQRLDLLEREAAKGRVPIYGLEWNKPPWQHINFFAYDKNVMKELRQILHGGLDLNLVFNEIWDNFPNQVAAIRHFHGGTDTHTYIFDPRLEWGMEVLRGRGDMLATKKGMFGGGLTDPAFSWTSEGGDISLDEASNFSTPSEFPFPVNFIHWKKAKLGLIGASDHHMTVLGACLTGFWVKELTGEGIFEALRNRYTLATANGKLSLWVTSNGTNMGQVGQTTTPVELNISVASPIPLKTISIWSDGKWVQHLRVKESEVEISFVDENALAGEHYYIVRIESQLSELFPKGPIITYSSPLWVEIE